MPVTQSNYFCKLPIHGNLGYFSESLIRPGFSNFCSYKQHNKWKGIQNFENCKIEKNSEFLQNELKCLKIAKLSLGAPLNCIPMATVKYDQKHWKFTFSLFWRPGVYNQGAGRAVGKVLLLASASGGCWLFLACGCLFLVSGHIAFSSSVSHLLLPLSDKGHL